MNFLKNWMLNNKTCSHFITHFIPIPHNIEEKKLWNTSSETQTDI